MYHLIKLLSYLARQNLLPNPFSNLFGDQNVAEVMNWIFGGILVPFAYTLTGIWYNGEAKMIGSIGFFVNYALLTGLFLLITKFFTNLYLIMLLSTIGYIILCVIESKILGKKILKFNKI